MQKTVGEERISLGLHIGLNKSPISMQKLL